MAKAPLTDDTTLCSLSKCNIWPLRNEKYRRVALLFEFMVEEDTKPQIGKMVRITGSRFDGSVDVGSDAFSSSLAWKFFLRISKDQQ